MSWRPTNFTVVDIGLTGVLSPGRLVASVDAFLDALRFRRAIRLGFEQEQQAYYLCRRLDTRQRPRSRCHLRNGEQIEMMCMNQLIKFNRLRRTSLERIIPRICTRMTLPSCVSGCTSC